MFFLSELMFISLLSDTSPQLDMRWPGQSARPQSAPFTVACHCLGPISYAIKYFHTNQATELTSENNTRPRAMSLTRDYDPYRGLTRARYLLKVSCRAASPRSDMESNALCGQLAPQLS